MLKTSTDPATELASGQARDSEPIGLDLFMLMARWREEDTEEDLAYLREFQKELSKLRRRR